MLLSPMESKPVSGPSRRNIRYYYYGSRQYVAASPSRARVLTAQPDQHRRGKLGDLKFAQRFASQTFAQNGVKLRVVGHRRKSQRFNAAIGRAAAAGGEMVEAASERLT